MAINKSSYKQKLKQVSQLNPYDLNFSPFKLNSQKASKIQFVLADLIGALHIDTHQYLKKAWKHSQKEEE